MTDVLGMAQCAQAGPNLLKKTHLNKLTINHPGAIK